MTTRGNLRVWDAADCALLLIDYQPEVFNFITEQDRGLIELNARTLAAAAVGLGIPVVLSSVGVEMGVNKPTIPSLQAVLPNVTAIDRSTMNAWEDPRFLAAVRATGRRRLVMAGIRTSVCLAFAAVDAMADGYEVMAVEDAVGDFTLRLHDTAMLRMSLAGAIPNTTIAVFAEWFRDWKSPGGAVGREQMPAYFKAKEALPKR